MIITLPSAAVVTVEPNVENRTQGKQIFQITPTSNVTLNANGGGLASTTYTFEVVTSGTTSFNVTFGTGFKSTGVLATGTTTAKTFTVDFISDGLQLIETARTTAQ